MGFADLRHFQQWFRVSIFNNKHHTAVDQLADSLCGRAVEAGLNIRTAISPSRKPIYDDTVLAASPGWISAKIALDNLMAGFRELLRMKFSSDLLDGPYQTDLCAAKQTIRVAQFFC